MVSGYESKYIEGYETINSSMKNNSSNSSMKNNSYNSSMQNNSSRQSTTIYNDENDEND